MVFVRTGSGKWSHQSKLSCSVMFTHSFVRPHGIELSPTDIRHDVAPAMAGSESWDEDDVTP
jgi:hypothetical protein